MLKRSRAGVKLMTLWDLMTALCFSLPLAGAFAAIRDVHRGWPKYVIATVLGIAIGALCGWVMRATGKNFPAWSSAMSNNKRERFFRALYAGAAVWIVVALFLGSWLTEVSMRLF